jgi:hypothetical protein
MSRSRAEEDFESERIFHEREWRMQRIGWICIAVFLALAIAGLFGGGPLSHARVAGAAGSIEYERFIRSGTSTELVVTPARAAPGGVHRVEISSEFLAAFSVESVTPEPGQVRMTGQRLVYEFAAAASGASISFHIRPQRLWRHRAEVRIDGGEPLAIAQLTYP